MKRSPIRSRSAKAKANQPALDAFRTALRERSGGACEANTPACPWLRHEGHHAHHRSISDRRIGVHDPERGLWVCHLGHSYIHANPAASYDAGWLLRGAA